MGRAILVVDDDEAARKLVAGILSQAGHQVLECDNGQTALAMVRDAKPDLVLMDVEMPGMGGREACRIIKANKSFGFVPIILVTARTDMQSKVEGLELGADDYLIKPLNPLELEARVKSMLRLKMLQDEVQDTNKRLKEVNEKLQELSLIDPLMGICNRLFFEKRIQYEIQRAERYRKPMTLVMADLDHFKDVNDRFGHPFGDFVLKNTADRLVASVRKVDIVARYGGEEFVIALPETSLQQAMVVTERIRRAIGGEEFNQPPHRVRITISQGMAVYPAPGVESLEPLLAAADAALYRAKRDGRDCIRTVEDQ